MPRPAKLPRVQRALPLSVFINATLLFLVQPLIGKYILPWFGGSPSTWTACLLFFQLALLVGYAYAHALAQFRIRTQAIVHIVVCLGSLASLPVAPSQRWVRDANVVDPTLTILAMLAVTIGPTYTVLAATGPLLQSWFARRNQGVSAYRLYALSNAGSMLALVSYPLLVEPLLSRREQSVVWSIAYVVAIALLIAVATLSRNAPLASRAPDETRQRRGGRIVLWLLLPAVASCLLMAVTNKICQDVAVVPFLWVLPLALYLFSFIVAFDSPRWYHRAWAIPATTCAVAASGWVLLFDGESVGIVAKVAVYAWTLLLCCLVCHGELYRRRPGTDRLTAFYLCVAAGGALGGTFVALVAPRVFSDFHELQISLLLTLILAAICIATDSTSPLYRFRSTYAWIGLLTSDLVMGMVLFASANHRLHNAELVERSRDFFGVLTVYNQQTDAGLQRVFVHAGTTHGRQLLTPDLRREPTAYYGQNSGVGRAFAALRTIHPVLRVGLVGQGAGVVAAYARPGDTFTSYELDASVDRIARTYFTFIADAPAPFTTIIGDGRLNLERETASRQFDLLVLDAFSGDAIPVHLLTVEAFAVWQRHLAAGGIIAVHISNKHVDLAPVLYGRSETMLQQVIDPGDDLRAQEASNWILVAGPANRAFEAAALRDAPPVPPAKSSRIWTDDHSALLPLLQ